MKNQNLFRNIKYNTSYCILNNKYKLSGFHSSVCVLSEEELTRRIENLKASSSLGTDISLTTETGKNMKDSLENLKNEISKNDVSDEIKEVKDFFNNEKNNVSSFDEAFPNYAKDKVLVNEDVKDENVFEVVKEVSKVLEDCVSKGYAKDCLEKLKLSGIVAKVLSKDSSDSLKKRVGDEIVNEVTILEKIGNITLSDIYNKTIELKDKSNININFKYMEMGLSMVSYGLLLKSYDKYVNKCPLPTNVTAEELRTIKSIRAFSRFWFAGLVAPALVFAFHQIRPRSSVIEINQSLPEKNSEIDSNTTKMSNFGWFFLFKKVNNWVKVFIILILILMFFMFDGTNLIYNIKDLNIERYYSFLKYFLLFIILIPIIINAITLYLLGKIEIKGEISIPAHKFFHIILNRHIHYLIKIGNNKELLSYYKGRCKAELVFYVIILILYFICLIFVMW